MPNDFLTTADAAKLLGLTPASVRHLANNGQLPVASRTQSGTRLFRRRDVIDVAQLRERSKRKGRDHRRTEHQ